MPIHCPTIAQPFSGICLFFGHPPVTQGGCGLEGVVPELVHSLDPAIWGQSATDVGRPHLAGIHIDSDNAPKIVCWMLN